MGPALGAWPPERPGGPSEHPATRRPAERRIGGGSVGLKKLCGTFATVVLDWSVAGRCSAREAAPVSLVCHGEYRGGFVRGARWSATLFQNSLPRGERLLWLSLVLRRPVLMEARLLLG